MKKVIFHYLRPYYARMALGFVIKFFGTIMDLFPVSYTHLRAHET